MSTALHSTKCLLICGALALLTACSKKPAPLSRPAFENAPSFWVWHRTSGLTTDGLGGLRKAGVPRLYWQIAEFRRVGAEWEPALFAKRSSMPDLPAVVPVLRLAPDLKPFDRPEAPARFAHWLHEWSGDQPLASLQVDYDCPVSQLDRYAAFLKALKTEAHLSSISVTALAGWISAPTFQRFAASIDELVPMFYDLTPDTAGEVMAGRFVPMVPLDTAAWIGRWKSCPVPWRAGLPNFERLTLFDPSGKSLGHLRGWTPADLLRCRLIERDQSATDGLVKFRVVRDGGLAGTALRTGQSLVWRAPDESGMRAAITAARTAGSAGITWFALPGPGIQGHHSPAHLAALAGGSPATPKLIFQAAESGRITLRNDGPGDLSFRPDHGPYKLLLESDAPGSFGNGDPGGFLGVESEVSPEFSRKISLSFSKLNVDEAIADGDDLWHRQTGDSVMWSVQGITRPPLHEAFHLLVRPVHHRLRRFF